MRFAKLWVLTLGVGSLLVMSAPVAHADCPLLDPGCLTGTVDDVTGVVNDAVEDVVTVVEDTVDSGVDVVSDTVEVVTGVVEETVETTSETPKLVTDTVDDVTGSGDPPVPVSPGGTEEPGRKPRAERSAGTDTPITTLAPSARLTDAQLERSAGAPVRPSSTPPDRPGLLERIGEAAGVAARQLSFPLALSLIVVAFVLFQNHLDRKDPKLAVAPIAADVMKFE
jgi:hypothetical protein